MIKFSGTTYLSVLTLPFHHRSIRRRKLEICSYFAPFLLFSPHIWVKSILGSKSTSWSICFRKMFCGDEPITVESLSSGHFFPLWRYSFSHVDFRREAVTRSLVCLRSLQSGQRERVWVDCPPSCVSESCLSSVSTRLSHRAACSCRVACTSVKRSPASEIAGTSPSQCPLWRRVNVYPSLLSSPPSWRFLIDGCRVRNAARWRSDRNRSLIAYDTVRSLRGIELQHAFWLVSCKSIHQSLYLSI